MPVPAWMARHPSLGTSESSACPSEPSGPGSITHGSDSLRHSVGSGELDGGSVRTVGPGGVPPPPVLPGAGGGVWGGGGRRPYAPGGGCPIVGGMWALPPTCIVLLFALLLVGCAAPAGPAGPLQEGPAVNAIVVAGDVPVPSTLAREDMEALGATVIPWSHKGPPRAWRGVPLPALLARCGFDIGAKQEGEDPVGKRSPWKRVVVATAADGYQAVFSTGEVAPPAAPTKAWVVWEVDGAPLPGDTGPFRLLVTTDEEGERAVRGLVRVDVIDVRKLLAPR